MKRIRSKHLLFFWAAFLALGHPFQGAVALGFGTVQKTFHTYALGDRTYTCLAIDGGVVPLIVPTGSDATILGGGDSVTVNWRKDGDIAFIRGASPAEAALLDLMGKPAAADAWKKAIASTLRDPGYKYKVNDFQPDFLDVNHWRIGAITMDYTIGGRKCSSLMMLWRCKDGSTLAVTTRADAARFKAHCDLLFSMIGGSIIMKP